jgi:hypothetical protein
MSDLLRFPLLHTVYLPNLVADNPKRAYLITPPRHSPASRLGPLPRAPQTVPPLNMTRDIAVVVLRNMTDGPRFEGGTVHGCVCVPGK